MIRRLLNGLAALLLLSLGLVGLPAFLLGAYRDLDAQMPDLVDLPSVLLSPGDGGLFLLLVLAIGWLCWAVFTTAFAAEVIARARGIRTPHLGAFFPQATMAQAVSSVALMLTLTPVAAHALPVTPAPAAAATATTAQAATAPTASTDQERRASEQTHQEEQGTHPNYVVERGDTLWDIADEQLDDPTRYPEIVRASEEITQPDGRQLTDPDLILPGWTLNIPDQGESAAPAPAVQKPAAKDDPGLVPGPAAANGSPEQGKRVVPPTTPMHSPSPEGQQAASMVTGVDLPSTPLATPTAPQTGGGPGRAAAGAMGPRTPILPATPMSGTADQPVGPPPTAVYREAVYDDEGRFAPTHGVLGLPNWITDPLTPTRPKDAPDLVAAAQRHLAAIRPGPGSTTGEP